MCCWCFSSIVLFCPRCDKANSINDEETNTHTNTPCSVRLLDSRMGLCCHICSSAVSFLQSSRVVPPLGGQGLKVIKDAPSFLKSYSLHLSLGVAAVYVPLCSRPSADGADDLLHITYNDLQTQMKMSRPANAKNICSISYNRLVQNRAARWIK